MTSLAPVPSEPASASCEHCGAALVADQRYCLSCGQPVSPVRLAFLDVLGGEHQPATAVSPVGGPPIAYASYLEPAAGPSWLRRYAPLFGVASVLLLAMIAGLLLGHWATQSKAPAGPEVVKIEGLSNAPLAAAASTTPTTTAPTAASSSKTASSAKSEEQKELAEAKKEEAEEAKAPAKAPPSKRLETKDVSKLEKTTGKKHEQELNKLTTAPIEVK